MDNLRLPKVDSATGRGLKTTLWTFIGTSITLGTALWLAIDTVPGCSDAIISFAKGHFIEIAGLFAVPSGVVGFAANVLNPKVKENY